MANRVPAGTPVHQPQLKCTLEWQLSAEQAVESLGMVTPLVSQIGFLHNYPDTQFQGCSSIAIGNIRYTYAEKLKG